MTESGTSTLSWTKEDRPRWDEHKQRLFGEADLAAVGLERPAPGAAVADEWWAVYDADRAGDVGAGAGEPVGYGWLDSEWGDAQITFFVAAGARGRGIGGWIVGRLVDEARDRGLAVVYNVVPAGHPDAAAVTAWLLARGFRDAGGGELRRQV